MPIHYGKWEIITEYVHRKLENLIEVTKNISYSHKVKYYVIVKINVIGTSFFQLKKDSKEVPTCQMKHSKGKKYEDVVGKVLKYDRKLAGTIFFYSYHSFEIF